MRTLLLILSPLAIVMPTLLLLFTWHPRVIANHANGGISVGWTRTILVLTLAAVLTLAVALPRL